MDTNSDQMKALLSELQTVLEKYGAVVIANINHDVEVVIQGKTHEYAIFGVLDERLAQVRDV